ncbi:MAG TPA: hypothetical protein VFF08_03205 [Trueperaceae bacterium]|nr:hypothetical protein [Trueperaceae bacterium]
MRAASSRWPAVRLVLALVASGALLTACPSYPPPVAVPFPDDPRVLDGTWVVAVTGPLDRLGPFAEAPEAPPLGLEGALLELTASGLDAEDPFHYSVAGTMTVEGETFPVAGKVNAYRLHEYVPGSGGPAPSVLKPPTLRGELTARDAATGEWRYVLAFETEDRFAAAFEGDLLVPLTGAGYRVRLERAAR